MRFFYLSDQNEQQYRGQPLLGTLKSFTKADFQTDADKMTLSVNQISNSRAHANHRATSKYKFEILSKYNWMVIGDAGTNTQIVPTKFSCFHSELSKTDLGDFFNFG